MNEITEDILLIKNFLKIFDVYYEKDPYESMLDIKYKGKTNLYQESMNVGILFHDEKGYRILISLSDFNLEATSEINENNGKRFFTLNYNLIKNDDNIIGKYIISSYLPRKDNKKRKRYIVKHQLRIYFNNIEAKYYKFYTIKSEVYLSNLITREFVSFNNYSISHKQKEEFTNVYIDGILNYLHSYFNNEKDLLTTSGGYELFKDNEKNRLSDVSKSFRIEMDYLDSGYADFIREQKNTLDYFYPDLFIRIVNNALTSLNNEGKEYIFGEKENNCYKLKR